MKRFSGYCLMVAGLLLAGVSSVRASNDGLSGEITPYVWMTGMNGTLNAGNKSVSSNMSFSDLFKDTKGAFSIIGAFDYKRIVVWNQLDIFNIGMTNPTSNFPILQGYNTHTNQVFYTGGVLWRFDGFNDQSSINVGSGIRYTHMYTRININAPLLQGGGTFSRTYDGVNVLFMIQPSYHFTKNWSFRSTMDVGSSSNDITYELQPEIVWQATSFLVAQAGYRRLYYKKDLRDDVDIDISFQGAIVGLGYTF